MRGAGGPSAASGARCADSMSGRAIQSPLKMPDIPLQAHPYRQKNRSASSFSRGVHIQKVRSRRVFTASRLCAPWRIAQAYGKDGYANEKQECGYGYKIEKPTDDVVKPIQPIRVG